VVPGRLAAPRVGTCGIYELHLQRGECSWTMLVTYTEAAAQAIVLVGRALLN